MNGFKYCIEDARKWFLDLFYNYLRNLLVECFGNASGDAGQCVAVAPKGDRLPYGILETVGIQE